MPGLLSHIDPDGLLEYSVVFTDRSLNHMSQTFQNVMNDISRTLKDVYSAQAVVVVPGGGTYAMEAVARQLAQQETCLVIRNGWFSYRWSQIFEMGEIPESVSVLKARPVADSPQSPFVPCPLDEVLDTIAAKRPAAVFAPHVETSSGMILPDDYLTAVAEATHRVEGIFVLDSVASGTVWVDMEKTGVDVLISAPQKGWSGSPCAGLVMLSERALRRISETRSSSFACDLRKWLEIMQAYEKGGHAYHATLPTDALRVFRDVMRETVDQGLEQVKDQQWKLGRTIRRVLEEKGYKSVAGEGYQAPGVVVCYADDASIAAKLAGEGIQIAAGVPLRCDEPDDFASFRIGLFGLEKLNHIERTVANLSSALEAIARPG